MIITLFFVCFAVGVDIADFDVLNQTLLEFGLLQFAFLSVGWHSAEFLVSEQCAVVCDSLRRERQITSLNLQNSALRGTVPTVLGF